MFAAHDHKGTIDEEGIFYSQFYLTPRGVTMYEWLNVRCRETERPRVHVTHTFRLEFVSCPAIVRQKHSVRLRIFRPVHSVYDQKRSYDPLQSASLYGWS